MTTRDPPVLRPAIFLDRDNTLVYDPGYLSDPAQVRLLPRVGAGLQQLASAGWRFVLVTNQAGIARGKFTEDDMHAVNQEMQRQLAAFDVALAAIYFCPYHPDGVVPHLARDHDERKPNPGMLLRAARELAIDLPRSWMIGDTQRDVEAGRRAGCRTVHVLSGEQTTPAPEADACAADFAAAAAAVIAATRT